MIKTRYVFRGLCRHCIDPFYNRRFLVTVPKLRLEPTISDKGAFHTSQKFTMFDESSGSNLDGIAGDSEGERSSSDSPSPKSDDDAECFFMSSYTARRRFSTFDDEAKVINLLKEILALRETNISNWIIESKVKALCKAYQFLLPPHREGFLKVLATEFAIDSDDISDIARLLVQRQQQKMPDVESLSLEKRQVMKIQDRLRNALTPQYSWLFSHVGRLENGVKFLVDLRTDVLDLAGKLESSDPAQAPVQQLNVTLRNLLSLWFSVGFLKLERVTWNSSCQMLQKISSYEAVHPVRSWTDLKRRVGLYRRCFMYTHSSMPDEPLVVLHTALCDDIARSMTSIVTAPKRMAEDSHPGETNVLTGLKPDTENPLLVKAAIFYSISSTQKGLQGIELGNYLIKRVVQELQTEFPMVTKFSTLSPIPGFHTWLTDKLKAVERGENEILSAEEEIKLKNILSEEVWSRELRRVLKNNQWLDNIELCTFLQKPLMRLCARYLFLEKRRGSALDSVANFHLKNGAVMWRINWSADVSPRGVGSSCGMMVNYRYILEDTEQNSRNYLENNIICASDDVKMLVSEAEALKSNQIMSKM